MLIGLILALPRVIRVSSGERSRLVEGMPGYLSLALAGGTPSSLAILSIAAGPSSMLTDMSMNAVLIDSSSALVAVTWEP